MTNEAIRVSAVKREFKHPITQLFLPIILDFCKYPEEMRIEESVDRSDRRWDNLTITVFPHTADYALICGKAGRQISAIKFLVKRAGVLQGLVSELNMEESFVGRRESSGEFHQDPGFDIGRFMRLLGSVCPRVMEHPYEVEHNRNNDKLTVYISTSTEEAPTIAAINDMLYPWGFRHGMMLNIKPTTVQPAHK
jgi:predicted RNA-binding protein YlqC (UPF0109 family)